MLPRWFRDGKTSILFRGFDLFIKCCGTAAFFVIMFTTGHSACADELTMQESIAQYTKGVDDASMARFDDAEKDFKRALELNDFNYDARESLRILSSMNGGSLGKDLVLALFLNKKMGFQITKLENKIKQLEGDNIALTRKFDLVNSKGSGLNRDIDGRLSNMEFRLNKIENDIDDIKRRTNLR